MEEEIFVANSKGDVKALGMKINCRSIDRFLKVVARALTSAIREAITDCLKQVFQRKIYFSEDHNYFLIGNGKGGKGPIVHAYRLSYLGWYWAMDNEEYARREEFRKKLKDEWGSLWRERFDDRFRAEGVSVRDYPLLLVDRGCVVFASRNAKTPSFSEIVDFWSVQGRVYSPDPLTGGWGKFFRTELKKHAHLRAKMLESQQPKAEGEKQKQQSKKGGRGWLHK